ncbi:cupin domain-containing protein [Anaerotalea alkaliphila]|uniref:Cupin domain-containing protein n=1 Tax=Anaerotalea alkaliphila TaxID=2662126 RepID=A0A7X5HVL6_9FIRM|nr:cupin domain-containing protein [Anaerotalea alkaliphila]NDL67480.1 cupin domain-containing protein [Anaerotalea alkaliphila]
MEKIYSYTLTDREIFENVFTADNLLMNHVVIPPGKVFPKHPTDAEVYALIVRGQLSVGLEDEEVKVYGKGQVVNIPKGVQSELGNRTGDLVELFVLKTQLDT